MLTLLQLKLFPGDKTEETKDEQKNIIDYLTIEVEKINTLKENVKKQIDKLKEYKKSLIYEYVTGKKRVKGAISNGN